MEYLGPIRQSRIDQLVGDFPGFEIRIVITARDLGRSVPAMWQETIKNRRTWAWPDYLESIRNGGEAGDAFWRQQALATITQRWVKGTSASQVTIVTVPPPGAAPEELWDRFSRVADLPAAWDDAPRANESLGAQSAAMMRRLNAELESLSRQEYKNRVKALAKSTMGTRRGAEDTIGFTVPEWLKERARDNGRPRTPRRPDHRRSSRTGPARCRRHRPGDGRRRRRAGRGRRRPRRRAPRGSGGDDPQAQGLTNAGPVGDRSAAAHRSVSACSSAGA